ncbi:hypothetical protein Aab01nite_54410 [Paractinoplanes abujensis]|nr:hypothetical protein Aab01nite_54410 [Actinoplanes abujensis]
MFGCVRESELDCRPARGAAVHADHHMSREGRTGVTPVGREPGTQTCTMVSCAPLRSACSVAHTSASDPPAPPTPTAMEPPMMATYLVVVMTSAVSRRGAAGTG